MDSVRRRIRNGLSELDQKKSVEKSLNILDEVVDSYHIRISMTANLDPLENTIAERFNGILKQEYLSHQPVRTLDEAYDLLIHE